jgi:hypothetical protein
MERAAPLRQFASGRERVTPKRAHQVMQGDDHPLVTFPQECGEDVFADLLAPEVIGAVTAGKVTGVQVDPVGLDPTFHPISPGPDAVRTKPKAPLQAARIDTGGVEVHGWFGHGFLTWAPTTQI